MNCNDIFFILPLLGTGTGFIEYFCQNDASLPT